jgi:transitional endoplasmic reticulum ATPase
MPFKINSDVLNMKDYNNLFFSINEESVVSLLSPLHTRDEIYEISAVLVSPNSFNDELYDIYGRVVLGEQASAEKTIELLKRELPVAKYSIEGTKKSLRIFSKENKNLYILSYTKKTFKISSTSILDPAELKENIPVFLKILETLVNCGYEAGEGESDLSLVPMPQREPEYKPHSFEEKEGEKTGEEGKFEVIPREFLDIDFEDVGGCKEAKEQLMLIDLGIRFPKIYEVYRAELPRGILLYGPPGTGKTMLSKAAAKELDANFYSINGSDILSKWYGESEKNLNALFEKAKASSPSVIFIDEIDALMPQRDTSHEVTVRIVSLLLQEMDGIESTKGVIIMGATNRPNHIDPAFLRPGRFDLKMEVPLPDEKALQDIYHIHLSGRNLEEGMDYEKLAKASKGLTGADVKGIVNACVFNKIVKLRKQMPDVITRSDLINIETETLTTDDVLKSIEKYKKEINTLVMSPEAAGMYA